MRVRIKPSSNAPTGLLNDVRFWWCLLAFATFCISGCGDFFASKPTEMESRNILREISTVRPVPDRDIPLPDIYKTPPKIIEGTIPGREDAKLYYFSKHHTSSTLGKLVKEQFSKILSVYDAETKKTTSKTVMNYAVNENPATNQLIVRCPTVADAQEVLEFLEEVDVPPVQVKIDCLISEVYADMTMDWETTLLIENLLGERISLGGKETAAGLLPAFPGAALRDAARATFGLKTGYVRKEGVPGHEFRALVDVLVSRGYLKILMNPSLEVVNGKTARISTTEKVPLDQITNVHPITGLLTTQTVYEPVVDSLEITPHVFANGYIGLETNALIGSKSTPEGVKQIPIVTKRQVENAENRIRQGESLVIGGIRKSEKRSVVRGVPFLKDIPLIGVLFSSKDFEERAKEVLFIITPTISSGGVPNERIVAEIKRKHANVKYKRELIRGSNDSLGTGKDTERIARQTARAEFERLKADLEKARALGEVDQMKERPLKTTKAKKAKVDTQKATVKDGLKQLLESLNPKR